MLLKENVNLEVEEKPISRTIFDIAQQNGCLLKEAAFLKISSHVCQLSFNKSYLKQKIKINKYLLHCFFRP